jgi:hypothetical protein
MNKIVSTAPARKLNGSGAGLPGMYKPMIMGIESCGIKTTADSIKTKILQDAKLEE